MASQRDLELILRSRVPIVVIETLDEIADENMNGFLEARPALFSAPLDVLKEQGVKDDEIRRVKLYRERHKDILKRLDSEQLTPRALRIELVEYYIERGKQQLRERFFQTGE